MYFREPYTVLKKYYMPLNERETLALKLQDQFPCLTSVDTDNILVNHKNAYRCIVRTSCKIVMSVYMVNRQVIFINDHGFFLPSVYILWIYPQIGVTITVTPFAVERIQRGGHLLLSDVVQKHGNGIEYKTNDVAVINTINNKAHIAVGRITVSPNRMRPKSRKCVDMYHFWGDLLCTMDNMPLMTPPSLDPPKELANFRLDLNQFPKLEEANKKVVRPILRNTSQRT